MSTERKEFRRRKRERERKRNVDSSMTIQVVVNSKQRNTRTDVKQMINDI